MATNTQVKNTEKKKNTTRKKSTNANNTSSPKRSKKNSDSNNKNRISRRERRKRRLQKLVKISLTLCGIALLIVYGVGVHYYSKHFHHNTYINGKSVKEMDISKAEHLFTDDYAAHKITITEKERTEQIKAQDVGAVIHVGSQIKDLHASLNPWLWFTDLWGKKNNTVYLEVTYDANALNEVVNNLACFSAENVVAPKNAYIKTGKKQFEIVPEVLGNTVKKEDLITVIGQDLSTCTTSINLETENLYKLPRIYSDNKAMNKALKKANKYAGAKIKYDFEYKTVKVKYNKIKKWINISKKYKVTLDTDQIEKYVSNLADKYDTLGKARKFKSLNGSTIEVEGGNYGWRIDREAETAKLIKNIESGKTTKRTPEYSYEARARKSLGNDVGGSYVEVNLSDQHLWLFYKGKCIVSSSVVTGDITRGRGTSQGVYKLTYKQRGAVLRGANYASPVSFWMPFNGGQGLHDATWRGSFGGSIYRGSGSHGCVNCPYSTAATLFEYVDTGYPVVVHW